jgi:hypothetical protein
MRKMQRWSHDDATRRQKGCCDLGWMIGEEAQEESAMLLN